MEQPAKTPKVELLAKIRDHTAVIGVVGLGYVGLPFAVEKAKVGFQVLGIEENAGRAGSVNRGQSYIGDIDSAELRPLVESGKIAAATDFERVADMDVIVICVPTPLTRNLVPDLSYVDDVATRLAPLLRPGQLVTLESTTYPGTTDDLLQPILQRGSGLVVGRDLFIAYSPERVDPGNKRYTTKNTSKVVGASDSDSLELAIALYSETIESIVPVGSAKAAELTKVFENVFRSVNIALVNELCMLCDRMGIDVWEVLDAANTKPHGIMPFFPGPGVGGHCIPLDPHYLEWKAREYNFNTHFISLAGEINRAMPEFVRHRALRVLHERGLSPRGASVLVLGVAYKKDLDDCRESPAVIVADLLLKDGAALTYHDPHVPEITIGERTLQSVALDRATLAATDLVLIATDHTAVDYATVIGAAPAVLDTRGVTRTLSPGPNVTLL